MNSLGAKGIKKRGNLPLEAGDIPSGQVVSLTYDGTNFQLSSASQVSPTYSGQSTITTVGTVSGGTWQGTPVDITHGGTGQTSKAAAFDALSPNSTKGDLISHDGTNNVRVAGNATTTNKFLTGSGNGTTPNAPQWGAIGVGDVPTVDHTKISDFDTQVRTSHLNQMATPNGDVSFGTSYKITNLSDPSGAQDAATKSYVDQTVSGRMPTGSIVPFAGVAVPAGWLLCNGDSTVSRSTQAALFAALVADKGTVTVTIASPAVLTLNGHGLSTGEAVFLETSGALPTGLSADTTYWATVINANTFKLATTYANAIAGTNINTSGSQSGTHHLYFAPYGVSSSTTFSLPDLRGRVPFGAGAGTPSTLGARYGSETAALAATDIPVHTHPIGGSSGSTSVAHTHSFSASATSGSDVPAHTHYYTLSFYPGSMDSVATVSTGAVITSSQMNSQVNAINRTQTALGLNPQRLLCEGRLTLTSGTAVTTSDVASSSNIWFTPFRGNRIALYDGTDTWNVLPFTEVSVALSGLTSGTNYDVFGYNNSGTLAIEVGPAWTNDSTRATSIALQDGVYVKNGTSTRRYLGTFRAIGTTTTTDSVTQRFLFNAQNRVLRKLKVTDGTDSWTYSAASFQQAGASAANKVELVVGMAAPEDIAVFEVHHFAANSTGGTTAAAGIGIDSTSTNSADLFGAVLGGANVGSALHAVYSGALAIGYHAVNWLEASSATGTTTFYGDNGGSLMQTGLCGRVVM